MMPSFNSRTRLPIVPISPIKGCTQMAVEPQIRRATRSQCNSTNKKLFTAADDLLNRISSLENTRISNVGSQKLNTNEFTMVETFKRKQQLHDDLLYIRNRALQEKEENRPPLSRNNSVPESFVLDDASEYNSPLEHRRFEFENDRANAGNSENEKTLEAEPECVIEQQRCDDVLSWPPRTNNSDVIGRLMDLNLNAAEESGRIRNSQPTKSDNNQKRPQLLSSCHRSSSTRGLDAEVQTSKLVHDVPRCCSSYQDLYGNEVIRSKEIDCGCTLARSTSSRQVPSALLRGQFSDVDSISRKGCVQSNYNSQLKGSEMQKFFKGPEKLYRRRHSAAPALRTRAASPKRIRAPFCSASNGVSQALHALEEQLRGLIRVHFPHWTNFVFSLLNDDMVYDDVAVAFLRELELRKQRREIRLQIMSRDIDEQELENHSFYKIDEKILQKLTPEIAHVRPPRIQQIRILSGVLRAVV